MTSVGDRKPEILIAVSEMLQQVLGDDWVPESPIGMETTFSYDLEVESIEFVALAEKLEERYGASIDFPSWVAQMELEELTNLNVGELVEYINSCL